MKTLIVVIVALLMVGVTAGNSLASCYGANCFNKDPYDEGCVQGAYDLDLEYTPYSGGYYLKTVLRKSNVCGAMWTTVGSTDGWSHHFYGQTYSYYIETSEELWNTSSIWTNMVCGTCGEKCSSGALGPANQSLNVFSATNICG